MHIRILGSAAGGGVPLRDCRCWDCHAARPANGRSLPRTQSSVAASAHRKWWFLPNVSPDIRRQIMDFPALGPPPGQARGTSIAGCLFTDGEIDHVGGLLSLRENEPWAIYGTCQVVQWLER